MVSQPSEKPVNSKHFLSSAPEGSGHWMEGDYSLSTALVHAGVQPDPLYGGILTPIYQSTTFVSESIELYCRRGHSYSRSTNPTVDALEKKIAAVEGGVAAKCFTTGMAATCAIISAFMSTGDHAIVTNCSYGGTNRAMRVLFSRFGMEFTFVDMTKLENITAAVKPNTKLVFSETPTNPTLLLADLPAISQLCKEHKFIHVTDTTFATPVICRPLDHGVDVVLQSTTKFYDGHNITIGGAVICATAEHDEQVALLRNIHGSIMTAHTAFFQLQTMKTMELRVQRQSQTAQKIANFLEKHPMVESVCYPGLASHPQKTLADKLHRNGLHGGMLWFEVHGGTEAGISLMDSITKPWCLCENLGASESIITNPPVMTHANMLKEDRHKVGITDGFIRLSCGLEDPDDLIHALSVALDGLKH